MVTITNVGQGHTTDGADNLSVNLVTTDGLNLTNSGINIGVTSAGTAAGDLARGLYLNLASTAGGTDTAIFIDNTAAWDVDLSLQNDEHINNTTDDTFTFEDDDGTDYATLTVTDFTVTTGGVVAAAGEFDVDGGTGSVTINDGGDLGAFSVEGTVLDINSLDFVGTGTVTSGANTNITMTAGGTGDFDVSIDADSVASFTASAAPGVDMVTITNTGQATTAQVNALSIEHEASNIGTEAVSISGDFASPAGADNLNYSVLYIDAPTPTNAAGEDFVQGIEITDLTDPGATITSTGISVKSGWDIGYAHDAALGGGTAFSTISDAGGTQTGSYTGLEVDYNSGIDGAGGLDVIGAQISLPALVAAGNNTTNYGGFLLNTAGAISSTVDASADTTNWFGSSIQMPAISTAEAGDAVTAYGVRIVGATNSGGGGTETAYGLSITGMTSGVADIPVFLAPVESTTFATEGGIYGDTTDGILYYRSSSAFAAMNADTDYSELLYPVGYDFAEGERSENSAVMFYEGEIDAGEIIGVNPDTGNYRAAQAGDVLAGVESGDRGNYLLRDGVAEREVKGLRQIGLLGNVLLQVTGDVSIGDGLTLSDISGVAMTATNDNQAIVGYARQSNSGDVISQIEILLMPQRGTMATSAVETLQGGNSTAVVAANLLDTDALSVNGDASFEGTVLVREHLVGSSDMAGRARIATNDTRVDVEFENEYAYQPIVTATLRSEVNIPGFWWVEEESTTGFSIMLDGALTQDVEFNWIAMGVENGVVTVSNGSTEEIDVYVLDGGAAANAVDVSAPVAEEPAAEEVVEEEAPAEEVVEETPVVEEPAAEEVVAEEAPTEEVIEEVVEEVIEETPVVEEPAAEEVVAEEVPTEEVIEEVVVDEAPVVEEPAAEVVVDEAPVEEVVEDAPVEAVAEVVAE